MQAPAHPATSALADALIVDPFYLAISVDFAADPAARKAVLASYFGYSLGEAARTGRCLSTPDVSVGAAAWLLPRDSATDARESAAKKQFLAATLSPRGLQEYNRIVSFMTPNARSVVPPWAWYLSILGVAPSQQGRGLGRQLLEPTLAEADAAGAPCFLETFTPPSVPFYEKLGFRAAARHREPVTQTHYLIMVRAPVQAGK